MLRDPRVKNQIIEIRQTRNTFLPESGQESSQPEGGAGTVKNNQINRIGLANLSEVLEMNLMTQAGQIQTWRFAAIDETGVMTKLAPKPR